MATGASTADAAVVLIDARKGVLVQSRRHAYIASLLRVRHVIVAVNKMDLIGYDEQAFRAIERDFRQVLEQIAADTGNPVEATFVPVSALKGDNVVHRAGHESARCRGTTAPRCSNCWNRCRPRTSCTRARSVFRCSACCGPITPSADLPDRSHRARFAPATRSPCCPPAARRNVERIVTWDGDLDEAFAPLSVTLVLDRELDISRGDLIVAAKEPATVAKSTTAALVWMDQRPLELNRRYLLKHASHTVPAFIPAIQHRTDVGTLDASSRADVRDERHRRSHAQSAASHCCRSVFREPRAPARLF